MHMIGIFRDSTSQVTTGLISDGGSGKGDGRLVQSEALEHVVSFGMTFCDGRSWHFVAISPTERGNRVRLVESVKDTASSFPLVVVVGVLVVASGGVCLDHDGLHSTRLYFFLLIYQTISFFIASNDEK